MGKPNFLQTHFTTGSTLFSSDSRNKAPVKNKTGIKAIKKMLNLFINCR